MRHPAGYASRITLLTAKRRQRADERDHGLLHRVFPIGMGVPRAPAATRVNRPDVRRVEGRLGRPTRGFGLIARNFLHFGANLGRRPALAVARCSIGLRPPRNTRRSHHSATLPDALETSATGTGLAVWRIGSASSRQCLRSCASRHETRRERTPSLKSTACAHDGALCRARSDVRKACR